MKTASNKHHKHKQPAPAAKTSQVKQSQELKRLKIVGYSNWEEAAAVLIRKKRPSGGWPK
jgi:hypothetical protein